jgi:hypothetical protein
VKAARYSLRSIQWRQRPCKDASLIVRHSGAPPRLSPSRHARLDPRSGASCKPVPHRPWSSIALEAGTTGKIGSEHHLAWPIRPRSPGCSGSEEGDDRRSDRCREMHGAACPSSPRLARAGREPPVDSNWFSVEAGDGGGVMNLPISSSAGPSCGPPVKTTQNASPSSRSASAANDRASPELRRPTGHGIHRDQAILFTHTARTQQGCGLGFIAAPTGGFHSGGPQQALQCL